MSGIITCRITLHCDRMISVNCLILLNLLRYNSKRKNATGKDECIFNYISHILKSIFTNDIFQKLNYRSHLQVRQMFTENVAKVSFISIKLLCKKDTRSQNEKQPSIQVSVMNSSGSSARIFSRVPAKDRERVANLFRA